MRPVSPVPGPTADALGSEEWDASATMQITLLDPRMDPAKFLADNALLREASALVNVAMRAPWWPRGLGVRIDDGLRCNCEPPGGAHRWMAIRHAQGRWDNEVGGAQLITPRTPHALLNVLVHAVRCEAAGMNAAALPSIPEDGDALFENLPALAKRVGQVRHVVEGLPSRGRLQPNERLTVARPLTVRDPVDKTVSTLLGQIAGELGHLLKDRFLWERPIALDADLQQRLLQLLEKAPDGAAWWLQADATGERIVARVHDGERETSETILTLPPGLSQTAMWSLMERSDPLVGTLSRCHDLIRSPAGDIHLSFEAPPGADPARSLANIDPNGRLLVVGHSDRRRAFDGKSSYTSDTVGGLAPEVLADGLIQRGLHPDFAGTLVLFSCFGASGAASAPERSFAERLRVVLAARGYYRFGITSFPGMAHQNDTRPQVFPTEVLWDMGHTLKLSRQALRRAREESAAMERLRDPSASARAAKEEVFRQGQADFYRRLQKRITALEELHAIGADEAFQAVAVQDLRAHFGPVGPRMAAAISEELREIGAVWPPESKPPN